MKENTYIKHYEKSSQCHQFMSWNCLKLKVYYKFRTLMVFWKCETDISMPVQYSLQVTNY